MSITGAESLLFGVDDLEATKKFLNLYGLKEIEANQKGASYRALDGSGVEVRLLGDPELPAANVNTPTLRAAVWGVKTREDLEALAENLSADRQIRWIGDTLESTDDDNNTLHFRVSQRHAYEADAVAPNIAGNSYPRFNKRVSFDELEPARQLGHVVYFSPDPGRSFAFYRDRLGFLVTDIYKDNFGIFARAAGHSDHHSIFFINNPHVPAQFQHTEFTFRDAHSVITGGHRLSRAGFETAFGPGRFELGSNWYWYLKTPMGGAFELGADMDQVDENWVVGEHTPQSAGGIMLGYNPQMSRQS
jgi:catechol 2,3-dioxygenase-like lactoylglutathione lyase family enzyme